MPGSVCCHGKRQQRLENGSRRIQCLNAEVPTSLPQAATCPAAGSDRLRQILQADAAKVGTLSDKGASALRVAVHSPNYTWTEDIAQAPRPLKVARVEDGEEESGTLRSR